MWAAAISIAFQCPHNVQYLLHCVLFWVDLEAGGGQQLHLIYDAWLFAKPHVMMVGAYFEWVQLSAI